MLSRKQRIASAKVTGIAAGYAQLRRINEDQARVEIGEVVAAFPADEQTAILTDAAASYVDDRQYFSADATALLAAAGADLEEARQLRAAIQRQPDPLRVVADQANQRPSGSL